VNKADISVSSEARSHIPAFVARSPGASVSWPEGRPWPVRFSRSTAARTSQLESHQVPSEVPLRRHPRPARRRQIARVHLGDWRTFWKPSFWPTLVRPSRWRRGCGPFPAGILVVALNLQRERESGVRNLFLAVLSGIPQTRRPCSAWDRVTSISTSSCVRSLIGILGLAFGQAHLRFRPGTGRSPVGRPATRSSRSGTGAAPLSTGKLQARQLRHDQIYHQ